MKEQDHQRGSLSEVERAENSTISAQPESINIKTIDQTTQTRTKFNKLIIKYAADFNDELAPVNHDLDCTTQRGV